MAYRWQYIHPFFVNDLEKHLSENVCDQLNFNDAPIFVNDLEKHLSENGCEQLNFNDAQIANFLKITVLLYTDDTIVLL